MTIVLIVLELVRAVVLCWQAKKGRTKESSEIPENENEKI